MIVSVCEYITINLQKCVFVCGRITVKCPHDFMPIWLVVLCPQIRLTRFPHNAAVTWFISSTHCSFVFCSLILYPANFATVISLPFLLSLIFFLLYLFYIYRFICDFHLLLFARCVSSEGASELYTNSFYPHISLQRLFFNFLFAFLVIVVVALY